MAYRKFFLGRETDKRLGGIGRCHDLIEIGKPSVFGTLATQNGAILVRGEALNISQNGATLANVFICFFFS